MPFLTRRRASVAFAGFIAIASATGIGAAAVPAANADTGSAPTLTLTKSTVFHFSDDLTSIDWDADGGLWLKGTGFAPGTVVDLYLEDYKPGGGADVIHFGQVTAQADPSDGTGTFKIKANPQFKEVFSSATEAWADWGINAVDHNDVDNWAWADVTVLWPTAAR